MSQRERVRRRLERSSRHLHGVTHIHHAPHSSIRSHDKHVANLAEPSNFSSTSFDILHVETTSTSAESKVTSSTLETSSEPVVQSSMSTSTEMFETTFTSVRPSTTTSDSAILMSTTKVEPIQLQVESSTSFERTTLIVSPTFSIVPTPTMGNSGTSSASPLLAPTGGTASSSWIPSHPMIWTRPIPTVAHTASAGPIAQPPISHPHISPALIVFMVVGGVASVGLSLYIFKRVRYKALHVSRSQFHITTDGSGAVLGSSSEKSFVSGGLDRRQPRKYEKNGHLDPGAETPLWGGKEKFSPQIGIGILDYPPAAHIGDDTRAPMRHRQSMLQTIRRYTPGNRLSRSGQGWKTISEHQGPHAVPTVKITDMDNCHSRLDSSSTFSSAVDGSPDPNLATIQVASVTRTRSAAASYRVGSPSPPPSVATGMDHPRPAPKAPSLDHVPLVPRIPAVTITPSERAPTPTGKKSFDANGRGRIDVKDISKPQPVHVVPGVQNGWVVSEADPMALYAKYSADLDIHEGSPKHEPIPHGSSMARKIAQVAHNKPMIATESQASLSNRDTRALAAAAGIASPIPGEEHTFRGFDKNHLTTGTPHSGTASMTSSQIPVSPGLGDVGGTMLRPFGEVGSILPPFLETPSIGLDNRSSYLSTYGASGLGSGAITGPLQAISTKATSVTLETDQSAGTLSPSMLSDDPSRRTVASAYSQDWVPLSQQAHMRQNPDYKSPTYSIYNYYGPDRVSTAPRMPCMADGEREEPQIGGAL
ncbi:hypothetical protein RhiJN_27995 [Ceratobasidium sp. AG-Ba]|nr:hypothetical protein RhiJN_27995 [Ceratobasidium sp. AG-Ba]